MVAQQHQVHFIVSAAHLAHVEAQRTHIKLAGNEFGAGNHGRGVIEELDHMPLVALQRMLVADEAQRNGLALLLTAQHHSEHLLARNAYRAPMLTQTEEVAVEPRILERMIGLPQHPTPLAGLRAQPEHDRGNPLPVAIVRGIEHDRLPPIEGVVDEMHIGELHATLDFVVADAGYLDGLEKVVGKVPIILFLNLFQFGFRFLREALYQILLHHLAAITQHIVGEEVHARGMGIEQPPGHQGVEL